MEYGEERSWEETHVACVFIIKEGAEKESKYYMWYPDSLTGPWEKYQSNPVVVGFGYLGGVLKIDGKYRIYSIHSIHNSNPGKSNPSRYYHYDYSPLGVAIPDNPESPFTFTEGVLLLEKGRKGDWDEGGFSEAQVSHHNNIYHMLKGVRN